MRICAIKYLNSFDEQVFNKIMKLVSNEKKVRIKFFSFRDDANRSSVGEILARKMICQELKIPKTTFNKFFSDEQYLPDAVAKLLGRVEDPKQIIMDTIVEMAHTANSAKAYREIAEFGMNKFIFPNSTVGL